MEEWNKILNLLQQPIKKKKNKIIKLLSESVKIIDIVGGENRWFGSISLLILGAEEFHSIIRSTLT